MACMYRTMNSMSYVHRCMHAFILHDMYVRTMLCACMYRTINGM